MQHEQNKDAIGDPYSLHYSSEGYIEIMNFRIAVPYNISVKICQFKEHLSLKYLSRNSLMMVIPGILDVLVLDGNTIGQLTNCLFDLIDYKIRISPENRDLLIDVKQAINEFSVNAMSQKKEANAAILRFPTNTLNEVFLQDAFDSFTDIENRLITEGYFNEQGGWIKSLDECAALIQKLVVTNYLLPKRKKNIWITKICKPFFEARYKVKFSKQMQPKYRKNNKLSSYFTWIEVLN